VELLTCMMRECRRLGPLGCLALACIACIACIACAADGTDEPWALPALDTHYFTCEVQPVLAARCAFLACHGSRQRPLAVYAVQRLRLEVPWSDQAQPLSDVEVSLNYRAALGFAATEDPRRRPLFLGKPLDSDAGGYYHRGKALYGDQDVFLDELDRGYRLLAD